MVQIILKNIIAQFNFTNIQIWITSLTPHFLTTYP